MLTVIHYSATWLNLTENWIYNQVRYLRDDIRSVIWCEARANDGSFPWEVVETMPNISRIQFLLRFGWRYMTLRKRVAFLSMLRDKYDARILHSHFGNCGWLNMLPAKAAKMKHVVTFYGYDLSRLPYARQKWRGRFLELFESVDTILCEGPYMAERAIALGCHPSKVKVQHLGVELDKISYRPRVWKNGEGPLLILIAASFREKKGIPFALEALGRLKHLNYEVTIIGDASETQEDTVEEKKKIMRTIKDGGIEDRVTFLGYVDQRKLWEEAYRHHLFLSTSVHARNGDNEGGAPIAIIEMMASGMLVVSSKHCDIPNVIEDEESGLLANEKDIEAIAEKVAWLYHNPQKWHEICRCARERVDLKFNVSVQGQKLAEAYGSILG